MPIKRIGGAFFEESPTGLQAVSDPAQIRQLQSGALSFAEAPISTISGLTPAIVSSSIARTDVQKNLNQMNQFQPSPAPTPSGTATPQPAQQGVQATEQEALLKKEQAERALQAGDMTAFNQLTSEFKSSLVERDKFRQQLIESLKPKEEERGLREKLVELRKQAGEFELATERGAEAQFGTGIALPLATGRAREVERQAQFKTRELQIEERNLIDKIGIFREDRELAAKIAQIGLSASLEDAKTSAKIFELQSKQEDRLLDRARDFRKEQRDALSDTLEQFEGVDPDRISPEMEAEITRALAPTGLSFSKVKPYLESQWTGGVLDRKTKELGIEKTQAEIQKLRREAIGAIVPTTGETGGISNLSFSNAFQSASLSLTADQRKAASQQFSNLLAQGDAETAKEFLVRTATVGESADLQNQSMGRMQAIEAMKDIEMWLGQLKSKGVETGILRGTLESVANRLGRTTDPDVAFIGNQIVQAVQTYRRSLSGVAFTPAEAKEYRSIFPNISDVSQLNVAKLESLRTSFERNQRTFLSATIGKPNYDAVFGKPKETKLPFGGTVQNLESGAGEDLLSNNLFAPLLSQ